MSNLNLAKMETETTWSFPVEPPLHVATPRDFLGGGRQTWSLISQIDVVHSIGRDGDDSWGTTVLGVAATKNGERRGTYRLPVYGPEAVELSAEAMAYVRHEVAA